MPLKFALSYKRLMDELDYTQEQVAERMGKDRSTVTNTSGYWIAAGYSNCVRNGTITMGHARHW